MVDRLGALILFASDIEETVAFYRVLGLPLDVDEHDDGGPLHYACELQGCHFAIFPTEGEGRAPGMRQPGASFPGFTVDAVEETVGALRAHGAKVLQEPSPYPWGIRAVVEDPDGRPVEVYTPPPDPA
jgi:lactoylglutathione lyase